MNRKNSRGRDLARTHVDFPDDLEILSTEGVGGFVTRVVYRTPEGSERVWTSRRHRKGRGTRSKGAGSIRRSTWLLLWAPGNVSWWVAVSFVLGSVLFALGAGSSLWLRSVLAGELAARIADWAYFVGATVFTGAMYLQILEAINADPHPSRARHRPDESFRWFAWQPRRLSYMEVFILLTGSVLFNVETALALVGVSGKEGVNWLLSVPSFLGAVLFVLGCYMQVIEACHRYVCLRLRSISWWSATFNFLGCVGFLAGAAFGFQAPGLSTPEDPTLVKAAYLQGSVFFLIGSYLMIPETFSE